MKCQRSSASLGSATGTTVERSPVPKPRVCTASVAPPESQLWKMMGPKSKSKNNCFPSDPKHQRPAQEAPQCGPSTAAMVLSPPAADRADNMLQRNATCPESTKTTLPTTLAEWNAEGGSQTSIKHLEGLKYQ